jgi:hypothetical protein
MTKFSKHPIHCLPHTGPSHPAPPAHCGPKREDDPCERRLKKHHHNKHHHKKHHHC